MSLHIDANLGDIASTVLITGDPLRAKHFAKQLKNSVLYTEIRGMFGYTGTYKGKRVSIQGTGMGIPSTALYMHELIHAYGVKCIIRIGTCGALQSNLAPGQLVLATEAGTDSAVVQQYNRHNPATPKASPLLLQQVLEMAQVTNTTLHLGSVFSTDLFYSEDPNRYAPIIAKGALGVDMETSMVYAMAEYFNVSSISLLTVSDNLITGEALSATARELRTTEMLDLALEAAFRFM
jgi:purine-nucleoside phosphorylase